MCVPLEIHEAKSLQFIEGKNENSVRSLRLLLRLETGYIREACDKSLFYGSGHFTL